MTALSRDTELRLRKVFRSEDRAEAERILAEQCADNLPLHEESTPQSLERIRFAAIKTSQGDLDTLKRQVELARVDWRDLLVEAGFAEDLNAHKAWLP